MHNVRSSVTEKKKLKNTEKHLTKYNHPIYSSWTSTAIRSMVVDWLQFNGTFSTIRLYHALKTAAQWMVLQIINIIVIMRQIQCNIQRALSLYIFNNLDKNTQEQKTKKNTTYKITKYKLNQLILACPGNKTSQTQSWCLRHTQIILSFSLFSHNACRSTNNQISFSTYGLHKSSLEYTSKYQKKS